MAVRFLEEIRNLGLVEKREFVEIEVEFLDDAERQIPRGKAVSAPQGSAVEVVDKDSDEKQQEKTQPN
jgi:hypothetical protein